MSANFAGDIQVYTDPSSTGNDTNLIDNQELMIDQRAEGTVQTSITLALNTTINQYISDRWIFSVSKRNTGTSGSTDRLVTQRLSADVLGETGITDKYNTTLGSVYFDVDNAGYGGFNIFSPSGSGNKALIYQEIEYEKFRQLGWAWAEGKAVIVSFYYYILNGGSLTLPAQQMNLFVRSTFVNRVYRVPIATPALSAGTASNWIKVTAVIPPPTGNSPATDWKSGNMRVGICFFDRTATNNDANTWDTISTAEGLSSTYSMSFLSGDDFTTPNCNFFFTKFVVSPVSSEITPRTLMKELELCRRYYEKSYATLTAYNALGSIPATITYTNANYYSFASVNRPIYTVNYDVVKRTNANPVIYNPATGTAGQMRNIDASTNVSASLQMVGNDRFSVLNSGGGTNGQGITFHYTVNADFV